MKKKSIIILVILAVLGGAVYKYKPYEHVIKMTENKNISKENVMHKKDSSTINTNVNYDSVGNEIDSYKGVAVYSNGKEYTKNFGKSYSKDGYYYGYKWQCVEHVKRFYYDAKKHKMPDGFGNAKDFFDKDVPQGSLNKKRGLIQYRNGEGEPPKSDDLIVFTDTKYGHVAIIAEVGIDYVEIIQQNVYKKTRVRYDLILKNGKYYIEGRTPAGWLRKE